MDVLELNQIRKSKGISFDSLSAMAEIPKSTVEKVLLGITKHPRIDTMRAIEQALGINEEQKKEPPEELNLTDGEKALLIKFSRVPAEKRKMFFEMLEFFLRRGD